MKTKGKLITWEGIEGAGKSTLLAVVMACLEKKGIEVPTTREPGDRPWASAVVVGLSRAGRRSAPDRFESKARRFFEDVRVAYPEIARSQPQRVRMIDAGVSAAQVPDQVQRRIAAFLDGFDR